MVVKRQKDPNSPKQPLTAYMLFYMEKSKIKVSKEERKGENMGKYVGHLWKQLKNKKIYTDKYEQNKVLYKKEMQNYKNKTNKSKRTAPKNAYIFFTKENRERIKEKEGLTDFGEISREVARHWRSLSNKEKYKKLAEEDRKHVLKELESTPDL